MSNEMFAVGTRVVLSNEYAAEDKKHIQRTGSVVAHSIMLAHDEKLVRSVYLIELDNGFYAPEGDIYIKTIPVDPSSVQLYSSICGCFDQPRMP